jgi:hypothetical protein
MTTHYQSSKGTLEIASMPLRYAQNASDKLKRDRRDDSRDAEIAALDAHIARVSEEIAQQQVAQADG